MQRPRVKVHRPGAHHIREYRRSLPADRRHLLEGYRYTHLARRVGAVGSVGTRTWIVLLIGRDGDDPLFLQFKEAGPSVLEQYAGRPRTAAGAAFDRALAGFAEAYADQNERDHAALEQAVRDGRLAAERGV
ncbi:MAG TPA: DUF2252 family protein [Solirubrobacteraceae bacterium]|nr:DUF2252 family protein [Solirubrobacteraceae bacterium]